MIRIVTLSLYSQTISKINMLTGKMTATWLILLTIAGCAAVPVLLIYYTTVHPFLETHPPKLTLILVDFIPQMINFGSNNMILH
ncbi:MAG: hypothetical protein R2685_04485 [Candidatus Nitrosocosmicus sp.]|jgi:hypothetical protein|nr:hypothetical protein [Candidatus Nitrosocosmicus sp.]